MPAGLGTAVLRRGAESSTSGVNLVAVIVMVGGAEELTWGEPTDERTFYKRKCCSQREEYVLKKKEEEDMSILLLRMYNLESQPEGKGVG